jgi:tRNA threonylcarbamoyladenosine biosynthesis protein TsaB
VIVLGLDTASPATAVALLLDGGEAHEARDDPVPGAHPGHATRLLTMADELLRRAGLGWRAVERIAVGTGPGGFTGLRVGIATARGLAQSLGAELVGVSSLAALAARPEPPSSVLAVLDARRGEVFAAPFRSFADGPPRELLPPAAIAPGEIAGLLARAREISPGEAWLGVGDGALRYRDQLERAGVAVPDAAGGLHVVRAAAICRLGAQARASGGLDQIVPDYRRRPDAEIALARAGEATDRQSTRSPIGRHAR